MTGNEKILSNSEARKKMTLNLFIMNHAPRIILFTLLLALTACSESESEKPEYAPQYSNESFFEDKKEYIIGIHPLHNPNRLYEIFSPIAQYLNNRIMGAHFKIEASRNYAAFDKKLYARQFHFSLPNPYQTVNSFEYGYSVFGKMADDENFRGIFLVRKDSGITNVADLKGKAVSFPAPTALAATMMPQYYLQTHGLNVMKDIRIRYVGSQESSIMNVMLGNTMAGATWPQPWRALSKERPKLAKELKVIWQTKSLPNNSLIARDDVDKDIVRQVKKHLLNLHKDQKGKLLLQKMELSHFEPATNKTYQPVIEFLTRFNNSVRPIK